jgi:hypothetical protein
MTIQSHRGRPAGYRGRRRAPSPVSWLAALTGASMLLGAAAAYVSAALKTGVLMP